MSCGDIHERIVESLIHVEIDIRCIFVKASLSQNRRLNFCPRENASMGWSSRAATARSR